MWVQPIAPIADRLLYSVPIAVLPILVMFWALAIKKMRGYQAAFLALLTALLIAKFAYGMPWSFVGSAGLLGAMNGLFPIGWIVFTAVLLYNISVKGGQFAVMKDTISNLTEDRRLQAILIGFCFGAFLEGAAGFGAPVAITSGLLVGLGFDAFLAAGLCLIANSAPVAFGGIGIAIFTASKTSGLDAMEISRMTALQLPILSFITVFVLVYALAGWKGLKEVLPAVFITALTYSVTVFAVGYYMGPTLPDIVASFASMIALILFLRFWKPARIWRFKEESRIPHKVVSFGFKKTIWAWSPFILLVICVAVWGLPSVISYLDHFTHKFNAPLITNNIATNTGKLMATTWTFNWLSAAGTSILVAVGLAVIILRISWKTFKAALKETIHELKWPLLTIAIVLAFSSIMNLSGITSTLGMALTKTGALFPLIAPVLGWLGVFITGSDTSANALFSNLQRVTAEATGVSPELMVASNSVGGVTAKMISPQNIAVAAGASNLVGKEGKLFQFTLKFSLAFLVIIGVINYVESLFIK